MLVQSNCFQHACCQPCCAPRPSCCACPPPTPIVSPAPTISPLSGGDMAIQGRGSVGCAVVVTLPNGQLTTAKVNTDGTWRVLVPGLTPLVPGLTPLVPGQIVSATQTCANATPSAPVQATVGPSTAPITRMVTGSVSPIVFDDLGLGPAFLSLFNTTVELRSAVNTPAPPSLTTVVVPNGTSTGTFTFPSVPVGSYVLYIHRPGYLFRTLAVTVTEQSPNPLVVAPPNGPVFNLFPGDINSDGIVDGLDMAILNSLVVSDYPSASYTAYADFNADSFINALDRSILVSNFSRASADYPGQV